MARRAFVPVLLVLGAALAGCGGSPGPHAPAAAPRHPTVWLCFPGKAPDPCAASLDTTFVDAHGAMTVRRVERAAHPAVDCFYVYPTVSDQKTGNANLNIDPEERSIALFQAARAALPRLLAATPESLRVVPPARAAERRPAA